MEKKSDHNLLIEWKEGNEVSFEELYFKYFSILVKYAYSKIGDVQIAEELVQDTFLIFFNKKDTIKTTPYLFLHIILKRKIIDNYRKKNHSANKNWELLTENIQDNNELFNLYDMKHLTSQITKIYSLLPEQCKTVFIYSRELSYTNKKIATILNISIKTVEAHITKALKIFREHLYLIEFYILIELYFKN